MEATASPSSTARWWTSVCSEDLREQENEERRGEEGADGQHWEEEEDKGEEVGQHWRRLCGRRRRASGQGKAQREATSMLSCNGDIKDRTMKHNSSNN